MKIRQVFRLRGFKLLLLVDERIYRDFAELQVNSLDVEWINVRQVWDSHDMWVNTRQVLNLQEHAVDFKILETYACHGLLVSEKNSFHAFAWFQMES